MSEQYFTSAPASEHNERALILSALDMRARVTTDAGVFSKGELDEGTEILLRALPEVRGRALDLGCGWGAVGVILGMKYPGAEIVMSDVNERACALAERNLKENGVKNARVVVSDAYARVEGTFDIIITNPPIRAGKKVIYPMFEESLRRLNAGGRLYVVIRRQQGAESAIKHIEQSGARVRVIKRDKGYWVLECERKEVESL